jgi:hypothetical protein
MRISQNIKQEIVIYKSKNGAVKMKADFVKDTLWATQEQIADLFGVKRAAITKHIKNIYSAGELKEKVVSSILELTAPHGAMPNKTQTNRVKIYNLAEQKTLSKI